MTMMTSNLQKRWLWEHGMSQTLSRTVKLLIIDRIANRMSSELVLRKNDSYVVQFYANRYIGTYTVKGNSVVGTTLDPIKEYFKFENLNGNNAIINYSNNQGDKYVFLAIKTN